MKKNALSDADIKRIRLEAAAWLAAAPDIPEDFDDMSTEDWTALNEWLMKGDPTQVGCTPAEQSAGESKSRNDFFRAMREVPPERLQQIGSLIVTRKRPAT